MQATDVESRLMELEEGKGFFTGLKLTSSELTTLRSLIQTQWLKRLEENMPAPEFNAIKDRDIDQYHTFSEKVDHKVLWPKAHRILSEEDKEVVKITFSLIFQMGIIALVMGLIAIILF